MIEFDSHSDCRECDLHETAEHVGLPARHISRIHVDAGRWMGRTADKWAELGVNINEAPQELKDKALLVVGEAPGRDEDRVGCVWIGWAGQLLYRFVTEARCLTELADVYLTNANRCRPPGNDTPSSGRRSKCRPHLLADIRKLLEAYGPDNLTILCAGAPAAATIAKQSIKRATRHQGQPRIPRGMGPGTPPIPIFYTYHPANLAPFRDPARVQVVDQHLKLVEDHLRRGPRTLQVLREPPLRGLTDPPNVDAYGLDIETYPVLRGQPRSDIYHPARAEAIDRVPATRMVACVSVAWQQNDRDYTAFWNLLDPADLRRFTRFMRQAHGTMWGKNIPFDLSFLRYAHPALRMLLTDRQWKLEDLGIINHLHGDLRPERSLKAIAPLFGMANYDDLDYNTDMQVSSPEDATLQIYNATDALIPLKLGRQLLAELRGKWEKEGIFDQIYGAEDMAAQRSRLVWTVLHQTEMGIRFDEPALRAMKDAAVSRIEEIALKTKADAGIVFYGKGSRKGLESYYARLSDELDPSYQKQVRLTDKRKTVAADKNNRALFLRAFPADHPERPTLELHQEHTEKYKLWRSYLLPLLEKPASGIIPRSNGMAYPQWFPVPSDIKGSELEGGTKQGRLAAKAPPAQTFPPVIKQALRPRYSDGVLMAYDLSQMELRMAAVLSREQTMLDEYAKGWDADLHTESAKAVWRSSEITREQRQIGKRLNFLRLYRGGGWKFREVLRSEGYEVSLEFAEDAVRQFNAKRPALNEWQEQLLEEVARTGHLTLPTGWTRTFIADREMIRASYEAEICNCPVQCLSAQVLIDIHAALLEKRRTRKLTFVAPLQIHDAILVECPAPQVEEIDAVVRECVNDCELWHRLCEWKSAYAPLLIEGQRLWPR